MGAYWILLVGNSGRKVVNRAPPQRAFSCHSYSRCEMMLNELHGGTGLSSSGEHQQPSSKFRRGSAQESKHFGSKATATVTTAAPPARTRAIRARTITRIDDL